MKNHKAQWVMLILSLLMTLIWLLLITTPVYADDCLIDPYNAMDCMRTPGYRQFITAIAVAMGVAPVVIANNLSPYWKRLWNLDSSGKTMEKAWNDFYKRFRESAGKDLMSQSIEVQKRAETEQDYLPDDLVKMSLGAAPPPSDRPKPPHTEDLDLKEDHAKKRLRNVLPDLRDVRMTDPDLVEKLRKIKEKAKVGAIGFKVNLDGSIDENSVEVRIEEKYGRAEEFPCPSCGEMMSGRAKFCGNCGSRSPLYDKPKVESTSTATDGQTPGSSSEPTSSPESTDEPVQEVTSEETSSQDVQPGKEMRGEEPGVIPEETPEQTPTTSPDAKSRVPAEVKNKPSEVKQTPEGKPADTTGSSILPTLGGTVLDLIDPTASHHALGAGYDAIKTYSNLPPELKTAAEEILVYNNLPPEMREPYLIARALEGIYKQDPDLLKKVLVRQSEEIDRFEQVMDIVYKASSVTTGEPLKNLPVDVADKVVRKMAETKPQVIQEKINQFNSNLSKVQNKPALSDGAREAYEEAVKLLQTPEPPPELPEVDLPDETGLPPGSLDAPGSSM
jgi:hypothetical protein